MARSLSFPSDLIPKPAVMLNLFQHPPCHVLLLWLCVMSKQPCVYLLASSRIGTLYIGVTSNLLARLYQHRNTDGPAFTSRHGVVRLVRYEFLADMPSAIAREKQLKRWHREWKMNLIERDNPDWRDLAPGLGLPPASAPSRTVDAETSSA